MRATAWPHALASVMLTLAPCDGTAQSGGGSVAFRDVRLFDGRALRARTTVVVIDGRIAALEPDGVIPDGVTIIEGRGHTLLPGLIDAHVHSGGAANTLEQALIFGVTTSLDMYAFPEQVAARRAEQRADGAPGRSDVFSAGTLVTSPGGHGAQFGGRIPTITGPAEAQAFVDDRLAEGSDYIKIVYDAYGADPEWTDTTDFARGRWPSLDRATLAAVVEAAHVRDKLAVVHVLNLRSARHAVDAGADGLVHVFGDEPADAEFVRTASERGLFVIPTLVVGPALARSALLDDPLVTDYLHPSRLGPLRQQGFRVRDSAETARRIAGTAATVRMLHGAGVPVLAGTDPPNPGAIFGASIHEEMERLVDAGLSPLEALRSATSVPADAFRLADRGRIARGLRGDLVLVRGDPTADIGATRDIAGVWKLGRPVDRDAFAATSADARAAFRGLGRPGVSPISDFENDAEQPSARVGAWGRFMDRPWGGSSTSTISVVSGGANGSRRSLSVEGTIVPNEPHAFAGAMYRPWGPADLSAKTAITFWARGTPGTHRVIAFGPDPSVGLATQTFDAGDAWTEVSIPLSGFGQVDPRAILGFLFTGPAAGGAFALQVDEVRLR